MKSTLLRRRFEDQTTSFIVRNFEDFYLCLLRYHSQIAGSPSSQKEKSVTPEDTDPASIFEALAVLFERMAEQALHQGGEYAAHSFKEALFVMTALADEFFLNLTWEGRGHWGDHLLESRFFGTHDAGDLFFKNLDDFLSARDPMRRDLAEVYLLALGLGFQGKYRNKQDDGKIKAYRQQLYVFIYHHEPPSLKSRERLFPEGYNFTLQEGQVRYLKDIRQWITIFSVVFGFLFILSLGVWTDVTFELQGVMNRISDAALLQK